MGTTLIDAAGVRAKLRGIRVNRTEDVAPGVVRVHFVSSDSARLAAARLLQADYEVARTGVTVTVTAAVED